MGCTTAAGRSIHQATRRFKNKVKPDHLGCWEEVEIAQIGGHRGYPMGAYFRSKTG